MIRSQLKIAGWLLWRDMRVLKIDFFNTLIDAMLVPATFIIIAGYIFPYLGMPANYGAFTLVSAMVFMAYGTTTWRGATYLISDIEGDRAISYELTLPVPSWMIFLKFACRYALNAMFINILIFPMGKILLWDRFDLSNFSVIKFALIYIVSTFFFGTYAVWTASWVKGMAGFSRFWLRYGSQLLFFSGYQFPWSTLNSALPLFSYINLFNPFVYAFEGSRAAVLGQEGSLPYWVCLGVLLVYSVFFSYCAHRNFKKRLDCL